MTLPLPRDAFPRRIETVRLCLRQPKEGEAPLYARWVREAYAASPEPLSQDQARAFADFMIEHWNRYGFDFLIIDKVGVGGALSIGHAGFKYTDAWPNHWPERYEAIELGYSIVPRARGQGYVTEAARALLTAAFTAFDVSSIYATCSQYNPQSAAVLCRCGMTELEGTNKARDLRSCGQVKSVDAEPALWKPPPVVSQQPRTESQGFSWDF